MAQSNVGAMAVALLADTRDFDKKMGVSTKKVSTFDKTVSKMGKAITKAAKLAAAAAAAAVVAFGASAVKTFIEFDTSMREVFTLMPDLSAEAREAMEEDIQALSEEIGVLPTEIIPALYQAISAGVPRDNVFEYMQVAGEAAVGGNILLKDSVVGLAQVMNAYGAEVDTVREYSDIMFSIVKDGITTMGELSSELFKVAPVAADLGIAFSSIAGWMAELTAQGVPTAEAASYMKVALNELSKAGTVASDTFEKAAGITFPKFIEAGGTLVEAFEIIDDYAIDADMSVKDMFGSIEAGGAVLMATGVHFDSFSGKVANAEEASGNTKAAYEEMAAGIKHEIDKLKVWWQNLQLDIGGDLTENLKDLLGWLEENRDAIGDGIKAIFEGIIDSLKWLQENSTTVKVSLITIAGGLTAVWVAANPAAAAILAVVGALAYFESTGGVAGAYDSIQELAQGFRDLVVGEEEASAVTKAMSDSMAVSLNTATNALADFIIAAEVDLDDYYRMMEALSKAQTKALSDLDSGVRFDIVLENFSTMASSILEEYGVLNEDIAGVLAQILGNSADMWSEATGIVVGSLEETEEAVTTSFQSQVDAVGEVQRVLAEYRASQNQTAENSILTAQMMTGAWDGIGEAAGDASDEVVTATENIGFGLIELTEAQKAFSVLHQAWLDAFEEDTKEANKEIAASYASMWESVKIGAATALIDMVNDFVDMADTRESEEKTHQENLQAIRDEYAEGSQSALETALGIAQSEYETHRTTVAGTLRDMFGDFTTFLADELLALAAAEAVKSAAAFLSLNPVMGSAHLLAGARYLVGWGALSVFASSIPGYAEGGVVPGPIGAPQMAVVHGGEEVRTYEERMAGGIDYEKLGAAVTAGFLDAQDEIGGGSGPSGSSSDLLTKLAQLLYDPTEVERERRGGVA